MKRILLICLLCLAFAGCTAAKSSNANSSAPAGSSNMADEAPDFYYGFDDVLIPRELNFNLKESYLMDTQKFKCGVQVFEGRVVVADLIEFFKNNMPRDNWTLVTAVTGEKSTLLFDKSGQNCSIQIADGYTVKVVVMVVEDKMEAVQENIGVVK
ncbi:MAG: hypothetical protein ACNI27_00100 [Desulfovibrio sp.]